MFEKARLSLEAKFKYVYVEYFYFYVDKIILYRFAQSIVCAILSY